MEKLRADDLETNPGGRWRKRRQGQRGIRAWLLEWVPPPVPDRTTNIDDVPPNQRRIVAVLNCRLGSSVVSEMARTIFLAEIAEPAYMLETLRRRSSKTNEFRPLAHEAAHPIVEMNLGGKPWRGPDRSVFWFGRSPCIYGRVVANLHESSNGELMWKELPRLPAVGATFDSIG